jgi:hypothetical protein
MCVSGESDITLTWNSHPGPGGHITQPSSRRNRATARGYSLVQADCGDFCRVLDAVDIAITDAAERHRSILTDSPNVRLENSPVLSVAVEEAGSRETRNSL